MTQFVATWHVSQAMQDAFAALSGDVNPIHTDALAARRLPFGRPAVHGMHLVLDSLDRIAQRTGRAPRRVRATFRHPVGIDDPITTTIDLDAGATAVLTVDGRVVAELTVDLGERALVDRSMLGSGTPVVIGEPADLGLDQLAGSGGSIPLGVDHDRAGERFPNLVDCPDLVAGSLAVTRLVGMHVPGLHSLLASIDLRFGEPAAGVPGRLDHRVASVDERFRKITIDVSTPSMAGSVTAFHRPPPVDHVVDPSTVEPDEFGAVRALVIGGSRGLGAVAVQQLAAGGADVRFTFHRGAADAHRVAELSPNSTAICCDVRDLQRGGHDRVRGLCGHDWHPTHVAWFASPPIFVGDRQRFSSELFGGFLDVYVGAFVALLTWLDVDTLSGVLWPSSQAVEDDVPGLAEYTTAKRVGEMACDTLAHAHPTVRFVTPRFGRLQTDQTATVAPVDVDRPDAHVLAALRALIAPATG